jgi:hypothetical protein
MPRQRRELTGDQEPVQCPYCEQQAKFSETSGHLYGGKNYGPVYECEPCRAWVGCRPGTRSPLGKPANRRLRMIRRQAHTLLDTRWRKVPKEQRKDARTDLYLKLGEALGIEGECHIGEMNERTALKAIEWLRDQRPQMPTEDVE